MYSGKGLGPGGALLLARKRDNVFCGCGRGYAAASEKSKAAEFVDLIERGWGSGWGTQSPPVWAASERLPWSCADMRMVLAQSPTLKSLE